MTTQHPITHKEELLEFLMAAANGNTTDDDRADAFRFMIVEGTLMLSLAFKLLQDSKPSYQGLDNNELHDILYRELELKVNIVKRLDTFDDAGVAILH